ncbi:hypothetical protein ABZ467_37855 [Streptomyces sp. NPDC005727]|uniref:hypothetical protein n=1 Tax=Streptomyces sp. NPDC005727 TaxID=3157053 RepID=UPI0033C02782
MGSPARSLGRRVIGAFTLNPCSTSMRWDTGGQTARAVLVALAAGTQCCLAALGSGALASTSTWHCGYAACTAT